ncbi:MAG: hypothetical protein M2R45_04574 [Verrucomicrobia subdivision 3 bacterium]|nr:hypothetical protein [Limisphaerales bacterium]MCS1417349.1 hypothetical protein [Limisphaerales bacterium]
MKQQTITAPAARITQGNLKLFSTSLKVETLLQPDFCSVDRLDPKTPDHSGYQRLLSTARAKKLAGYILAGQEQMDAFLPTSVFLATKHSIAHDKERNMISFNLKDVGPFSVVDGQHRLEGLRLAAERAQEFPERYPDAYERILDFEVPVNIAVELPLLHQMSHFLIVNTTQKSVDKAVAQRIQARLTQSLDVDEDMPTLPDWIRKIVEKGDTDKAVKIVVYLNEEPDSPWCGKIQMANEDKKDTSTIKQGSFVSLIDTYLFVASNPFAAVDDFEKQKRIFLNYWKAIVGVLDVEDDSLLYKHIGANLFCVFSSPFFQRLQAERNFTVKMMRAHLKRCFNNMEGEDAGVGDPSWWQSGQGVSFVSAPRARSIAKQMAMALNRGDMGGEIEM